MPNKTKISIGDKLKSFIKSNKEVREKIAKRLNFASAEAYLKFLRGENFKPKTKKSITLPVIHNIHILDASGSMAGSKLSAAMQGINGEIEMLKQNKDAIYLQTIVSFSGFGDIVYHNRRTPIAEVNNIWMATRGDTALYHTLGEVLTIARNRQDNEKVLVKCFTDGQENASGYSQWNTSNNLRNLIASCEEEGFTVTFVGTAYDVKTVITKLGINVSNTLSHDNTSRGITDSFIQTTGATVTYAGNVKKGRDVKHGFYKNLVKENK